MQDYPAGVNSHATDSIVAAAAGHPIPAAKPLEARRLPASSVYDSALLPLKRLKKTPQTDAVSTPSSPTKGQSSINPGGEYSLEEAGPGCALIGTNLSRVSVPPSWSHGADDGRPSSLRREMPPCQNAQVPFSLLHVPRAIADGKFPFPLVCRCPLDTAPIRVAVDGSL